MSVIVLIKDANVYYTFRSGSTAPSGQDLTALGNKSDNHDLLSLPNMATVNFDTGFAPITSFDISTKRGVKGVAAQWLRMSEENFVRFKNGGKRLPSSDTKMVVHEGGVAFDREREDRENALVREGDVGPYSRGVGNLKRGNLMQASHHKPAAWSVGGTGTPAYFETDPSHPDALNRDHQNNQNSLKKRKVDPSDGVAIAIPQWVHMNGYTFGNKAKDSTIKQNNADFKGQSRSQWIAAHPESAFFKEIYQTIRFYADSGQLTYEMVGSYRYLYKTGVSKGQKQATSALDNLFMHYLALAT